MFKRLGLLAVIAVLCLVSGPMATPWAQGAEEAPGADTLVRHVRRWAQEQGVIRLTLLADRSNSAARRFYESEGFASS